MCYLVFLLTCSCQCCVYFPRITVGWLVFVLNKQRNAENSVKYVNCCRRNDCLNFATSKYDSRKKTLISLSIFAKIYNMSPYNCKSVNLPLYQNKYCVLSNPDIWKCFILPAFIKQIYRTNLSQLKINRFISFML